MSISDHTATSRTTSSTTTHKRSKSPRSPLVMRDTPRACHRCIRSRRTRWILTTTSSSCKSSPLLPRMPLHRPPRGCPDPPRWCKRGRKGEAGTRRREVGDERSWFSLVVCRSSFSSRRGVAFFVSAAAAPGQNARRRSSATFSQGAASGRSFARRRGDSRAHAHERGPIRSSLRSTARHHA
jgi:hypothetical protein